jgi:hypothetical protein
MDSLFNCNCQCHHKDEIVAKLAFLELAKELDALSDLDAFTSCSKELAMVAEMIRNNQFDDCIRDAAINFIEIVQPKP